MPTRICLRGRRMLQRWRVRPRGRITVQFPLISEESIMERLDELSRLLAESVSRRESLRRIVAFSAGAVLSPLGLGTARAARPDRCGAYCRGCSSKAHRDQCLAACRACNGNTSRLCGTCGAYACCPTSAACCNGTCTAVSSDANNCGACGNVCPSSAPICNQGTCITSGSNCPPGTDFNWDANNCGACGHQCQPL
jgi:hypothetical protein